MPRRPVSLKRPNREQEPLRLWLTFACLLGLTLTLAAPADAQGTYTAGALLGQVESRQLHSHADDTEARTDVVFGAFVDVATPLSWLHIGLEASIARRGGDYQTTTAAGPTAQSARIDYLSFSLMPAVWHDFGPFALYVAAGFARESDVGIGSTAELAPLFDEPSSNVFALTAAAGLAHIVVGNVDFVLASNILVGTIPGVLIGSRLGVRLPEKRLASVVAAVALVAGLRLL